MKTLEGLKADIMKDMDCLVKARDYLLENGKSIEAQKEIATKQMFGTDGLIEIESDDLDDDLDNEWIRLCYNECYLFMHNDGTEWYQLDPSGQYNGEIIDVGTCESFAKAVNDLTLADVWDGYDMEDSFDNLWDDQKKKVKALLDYLNDETGEGYTVEDIELRKGNDFCETLYDIYKTPEGEFSVLTDDERKVYAENDIENLLSECGFVESFDDNAEYVIENFCEWQDGENYMYDDYKGYYGDIESESASDDIFENRLQEELFEKTVGDWANDDDFDNYKTYREEMTDLEGYDDPKELAEALKEYMGLDADDVIEGEFNEHGDCINIIINGETTNDGYAEFSTDLMLWLANPTEEGMAKAIEDYVEGEWNNSIRDINDIKAWFDEYDEKKDDLIEEAVQSIVNEYDNPISWALEHFGSDFIMNLAREGYISINTEELTAWVTGCDGYGNTIASYDGNEHESGDYYIYKQDDERLSRVSEKKEEMDTIDKSDVKGAENSARSDKIKE